MSDASNRIPRRRILLLGPTGQVGWELRRSLQSLGEVISVGRVGESLESKSGRRQQALAMDLSKPDTIREVVRQVEPQVIVNAAAYTAVDKAEEQAELALAINGIAPGVLAEEARLRNCALIHYSTDYVFDGSGDRPWREEDDPAPINSYGRTKLTGEEAIRASGAGHLILRVSWVHGVHGANFVKTMLRLAAQRTELSIVNDQVGSPTSARVIADATANILAQLPFAPADDLKERGGTFHLTCQGETNWHEYALEIFRQARERGLSLAVQQVKPIPSTAYPVPATRPLNSRMNCRRLAERFHITPPDWQTALWHVLEDFIRVEARDQELAGRSPLLRSCTEENAA
jgi:dTDP-4-dehydrorhamnose reductase